MKGTAARGTGLEPYKEKMREKVCQCKSLPPGYLHVSGCSGTSGIGSRNGRVDAWSQLLLWEDRHTQGSFRAEDLKSPPPLGRSIQGSLHSKPALPFNPGL